MKIEFIKRGAATRLILIFAGWSTDSRYYNDCIFDGWDTAVVSDYRDLTMPPVPEQYRTVYVFAYSLGVAAASGCPVPAAVRIAICGSPQPVSDQYGIPDTVYAGTIDGLNEKSLMKFHLRMAGGKWTFDSIKTKLPEPPDIPSLKEELRSIRTYSREIAGRGVSFDRVYLAEDDRIFPYANLIEFWRRHDDTSIVTLKAPHAVDLSAIIRDSLPDTVAIGEGFQRAGKSYNENAMIQREICRKMAERLEERLPVEKREGMSLLEIGPGQGLLTEEWRRLLHPKSATYVDLAEVPYFGIAEKETYLQLDAEQWLEDTDRKFDIILSASTMQWFADPLNFLNTVKSHLRDGGIAVISTFVKGNLHELDRLRPCPILYRSKEEYLSIEGVEGESWQRTIRFNTGRDMLMHLRMTGVTQKRKYFRDKRNGSSGSGIGLGELPCTLTYRPMILIYRN